MYRRSVSISVLFVILALGGVILAQDLPAGASSLVASTPSQTLPAPDLFSTAPAAPGEGEDEGLTVSCNVGGFIASNTTWTPLHLSTPTS